MTAIQRDEYKRLYERARDEAMMHRDNERARQELLADQRKEKESEL